MKLVVVESPLAAGRGWNRQHHTKYARLCLADSLDRGEAPFASHLLYPKSAGGPLSDLDEEERHRGIFAGLAWAGRADLGVFYMAMGESPGMTAARAFYRDHGIPTEDRTGKWMPCRHCRMTGWDPHPPRGRLSMNCSVCQDGKYKPHDSGLVLVSKACRGKCCREVEKPPAPPRPRMPVR